MNSDPASLDNLRDIVEPPAVSFWPPAAGWWFLLAVLLIVAAVALYRILRTWRANAYRREALRELQSATRVVEVADILKRTALVAFPRTEVAGLTGTAWSDWLAKTSSESPSAAVAESLCQGVYAAADQPATPDVLQYANSWVRGHRC